MKQHIKPNTKKHLRKNWVLGFFGFFGIKGIIGILNNDLADAIWVCWLIWFIYFIPVRHNKNNIQSNKKKK